LELGSIPSDFEERGVLGEDFVQVDAWYGLDENASFRIQGNIFDRS
jgi:hypothetical protein